MAYKGSNTFELRRALRLIGGIEAITLTGNRTLTAADAQFLEVTCSGASRDLTLPATASKSTGLFYSIYNASVTALNVVVKNAAGSTIGTVNQGEWGLFGFTGSAWKLLGGTGLANTDFGSTGLKTDVVSESTSAAGVTIDGVLLKDNNVTVGTAGQVVTDTIVEKTGAAGVTIDGVLLKDGVNRGTLYTSNVFLSTEQTGNGGAQNVAHGLGATPALVFAIPSDLTGGAFTVAYGAHDATNAVVTVTTGEKYRVVAFK